MHFKGPSQWRLWHLKLVNKPYSRCYNKYMYLFTTPFRFTSLKCKETTFLHLIFPITINYCYW